MQFDYEYLCSGLGHLTGLEVHIYKKNELVYKYAHFQFEPSPISLILPTVKKSSHSAGYFSSEDFLTFGAVKVKRDGVLLIIGPTSHFKLNRKQVDAILHQLGEADERLNELYRYFEMLPSYPMENFLQILCFVNYALNGEKLTVADLVAQETSFNRPPSSIVRKETSAPDDAVSIHNTFEAERAMLGCIISGNVSALKSSFAQPPTGRVGRIAHDELRQRKNTFVCAATLASRAAITGGLSPEVAFTLSDSYIQKAELLNDPLDLTNLSMGMLLAFAKRVEQLKCGEAGSAFVVKLSRYVSQNIHNRITMNDLATALNMNRSYLCERFKDETGKTPGTFIHERKIDEAKHLLTSTEHSISRISESLSYSSQSYFQNVFKQMVGCTPAKYRRMEN